MNMALLVVLLLIIVTRSCFLQTVCISTMDGTVDDVPLVLVTGASGFVATHIVQQLQQTGQYRVNNYKP